MKEIKFTTTINCNNCIRAVSGFLDDVPGIESWKVDTDDPQKVLTVSGETVKADAVIDAVEDAGFDIKRLEQENNG